jgi:hypothetical protein
MPATDYQRVFGLLRTLAQDDVVFAVCVLREPLDLVDGHDSATVDAYEVGGELLLQRFQ